MRFNRTSHDLLKRFTPTPLVSELRAMGRTIRLETNSSKVEQSMRRALAGYEGTTSFGHPEFLWRIVTEARRDFPGPWPQMALAWEAGLYCINLGQRSFLAIDLEAREAVGFLAEDLAEDEASFKWPLLATLFTLSAQALRLTALSAACVGQAERALLISGPRKTSKAIASHLAQDVGRQSSAGHITFLECEAGALGAWGEFWPVGLHAETRNFLPELWPGSQLFRYSHQAYWPLEKSGLSTVMYHRMTPVACVFLSRQKASRMTPLDPVQFAACLEENFLFRRDERLEPRSNAVLGALSGLPAYTLDYGSEPAEAADWLDALLHGGRPPEAKV